MRSLAKKRYGGGFTYIGLLLAIVIMGAVLGSTAEVWHTAVQREKERELLFVGNQFRMAISLYHQGHANAYPPSLEDLLKDKYKPSVQRYLRKIYYDPMTGSKEWGLVRGTNGGIVGVHSLSEEQPIKSAGFIKADNDFSGAKKYSDWVFMDKQQQQPGTTGGNIAPGAGMGIMKQ